MGQRRNFKRNLKKYFELNKNESTTYQNVQDAGKAVLRGKCIAANAYIRKKERYTIKTLSFHLGNYKKKSNLNPNQVGENKF